jgi:hypothetical protein
MRDRPALDYTFLKKATMNTQACTRTRAIGLTALAFTLGIGVALASSASADTVDEVREPGRFGCDPERHAAMEAAMAEGYEAWAELMEGKGRISQVVTEENFDTFVEMHEAMEDGNTEEAQELREELGLGVRPHDGSGYRGGQRGGMGMRAGNMHRGIGSGDGVHNRWGA